MFQQFRTLYCLNLKRAMMKNAYILHNPGAGDEGYSDSELISLVKKNGFGCDYSSLKDSNWKDLFTPNDFLIITGGDGTIRKVIKQLLKQKSNFDFPIAIIPSGTANNISKSLGVNSVLESQVKKWKSGRTTSFDIGWVENGSDSNFFLESFGCGLFPRLMKEMKGVPKALTSSPDQKIRKGLEMMYELLKDFAPSEYQITVDGKSYNGSYLMVEAMNIKSLGPNLMLAPEADFGDGRLELVLVEPSQKQALANYLEKRLNNEDCAFKTTVIKGKQILIQSSTDDQHLDDKILEQVHEKTSISVYAKQLNFLVG